MTDLDQRLRNAIGVLADAEPVSIPPLEFVHERTPRTAVPRRSRVLVAAMVIGALALAAAAGGAAGVLPPSITRVFHRISSWSKECRVDSSSARMLASYRLPDGRVFEWWRAVSPRRADGSFTTGDDFRTVSPGGTRHDQAMGCQTIAWSPGKLVLGGMSGGDRPSGNVIPNVIWGQAPEGTTTAVRAVYRDGTTVEIPLQHGRYFITSADPATYPPGAIVRIEALGANGTVIAAERNSANAL